MNRKCGIYKIILASVLFLTWQFISMNVYAQFDLQKKLATLHLKTLSGKDYQLPTSNKKSTVIVFLSPECPLCQNYSLTLNNLSKKYSEGLDVIGVFPGKGYSIVEYKAFREKYNISFLLVVDKKRALTKILAATTTPEAFLVNKEKEILYSGAIDNWSIALGQQRTKPTENYLEQAIINNQNGSLQTIRTTPPIGCRINNY